MIPKFYVLSSDVISKDGDKVDVRPERRIGEKSFAPHVADMADTNYVSCGEGLVV